MTAPGELLGAPDDLVKALADEAARQDVILSEVGAWLNNPIHPDAGEAERSIAGCQRALDYADRVGARCAVNIAGSCSATQWDGPHPKNLTTETFDAIVESTRKIVDAVRPRRACYALETMPWIFPDSPESYVDLLKAIDRKSVGVHLDVANMINCPARAFDTTSFIHRCFDLLGPRIVALHAKDVAYRSQLTFHVEEVGWGEGVMDAGALLRRASELDPDLPVGLEHLPMESYAASLTYLRGVARTLDVEV